MHRKAEKGEFAKMRHRTEITVAMALLGALALHGPALAQGGPGFGPGPGGPPGPPVPGGPPRGPGPSPAGGIVGLRLPPPEALERLGLSDAQRAKIDNLLDAERRKAIRADADLRIAQLDLQKLIESDRPDQDAIDGAIGRLTTMRADMLKSRVATILGIRAILTPSQRAKLRRPASDSPWH